MPDLLIELLSEEIPARMQPRACADLRRLMTDGLVEAGLTYAGAAAHATPRRLVLAVHGLTPESPATREERRGPREGAPDKAVEGFARGAGVAVEALELRDEKKGRFHYAVIEAEGRPADAIVAEVLERTIRGFPWPRSMRWGEGALRWVRPLRRILCVLSDEAGHRVVPLTVDGIEAGDVTEGHPAMSEMEIRVTGPEDHAALLRRAHVMLSAEERATTIMTEARNLAFARGLEVIEDPGLLAEVAGLVEWPVVLMGEVGDFQDLPAEVLRTSMKEHQKFFSVRDREGSVVRFVTVADHETADDGATVLAGNRRVLTARLTDARFFWNNDLAVARAGMEAWRDKLASVTFHEKLGSQAERIARVAALAREIAPAVGAEPKMAEDAARLAKLDLASEMVFEFPELQGVMGRHYLAAAGEPEEVAAAAETHYAPLGPSDAVPSEPVSVAVALADKLDTLTGFWAIDEKPTGSKDPFALRRAAIGVIRLAIHNKVRLRICGVAQEPFVSALLHRAQLPRELAYFRGVDEEGELWNAFWEYDSNQESDNDDGEPDLVLDKVACSRIGALARDGKLARVVNVWFQDLDADPPEKTRSSGATAYPVRLPSLETLLRDLLAFLHDRLKVYLRDRGVRHDVINASLAMPGSDDLTLLVRRAEALQAVLATEDGTNLVQGYRRAANILAQAEGEGAQIDATPDPALAQAPEERALFDALAVAEAEIVPAMEHERFHDAMRAMAALRGPVDAFFEAAQVNTDDPEIRANRLALLARVRAVCGQVADLSRLEG